MLHKKITLRFTLSALVLVAVLLTAIIGSYSAIQANKESLTQGYMQSNYEYAQKLSSDTSDLLKTMQKNLNSIATSLKYHSLNQTDFDIYANANQQYFNSLFIVDKNRTIQKISPATNGIPVGSQLTSEPAIESVRLKKSLISKPYIGKSGRLIILLSSPIYDKNGNYAGFVGGTIYLEDNNVLGRLLSNNFLGNASYVYVVDKDGRILFHPDKHRINDSVLQNPVVRSVITGENGYQEVTNSEGKQYYAGYAYESSSGWGIVSQTPTSVINQPLKKLETEILLEVVPLSIAILLAAWLVANRISRPLYKLAKFSEDAILQKKLITTDLQKITSNTRIYEVKQLYQSINNHLKRLNLEIQKDGLTQLENRKTFDFVIEDWVKQNIPFSLLMFDIDHFKSINDTYGHQIGDEVLKYIGFLLRTLIREEDYCFRYGGEEFVILIKYGDVVGAASMAERLRQALQQNVSPTGSRITVSIGVSSFDHNGQQANEILRMADDALYQSKQNGRDRITIANTFLATP